MRRAVAALGTGGILAIALIASCRQPGAAKPRAGEVAACHRGDPPPAVPAATLRGGTGRVESDVRLVHDSMGFPARDAV
jgi:hypothetical protein